MRGVQRRSVGDSAEQAMTLRTARLILTPLSPLDEADHARASGNSDDALRDTRAAELQWREHGFGPWAIRDLGDNSFLGAAELRFAGDGIEGIAPNEVEAGWWVRENRRNQRIATEAMRVAIGDLWRRERDRVHGGGGERTVASSRGQPRLQSAQPGPRSLRRTDDGVRASSRGLGSTRRLKAAGPPLGCASVLSPGRHVGSRDDAGGSPCSGRGRRGPCGLGPSDLADRLERAVGAGGSAAGAGGAT